MPDDWIDWLREHGVERGATVAVVGDHDGPTALAIDGSARSFTAGIDRVVATADAVIGPRWAWWDRSTADLLVERGVDVARCWDVLTVHRLLHGGWRTSVPVAWAWLHDLPMDSLPSMGQLDLLTDHGEEGDPEHAVRPDGHLRPEWVAGGWIGSAERTARWAALIIEAVRLQLRRLDERSDPHRARSSAHSESAAELMCAQLTHDGLPLDVDEAVRIIADAIGPRPRDEAEAQRAQADRDAAVLRHVDPYPTIDLRNPGDVRAMLRRVAVDVPDTRAWRLEAHRETHPVVPALLQWRKAERIATTYGYRWLDEHVRDGRLRGEWTSSDGAAGRMTASSGLHNLPAEMRPAVTADEGFVFVRADLGQIEPRVLAAVSGDPAFVAATASDDLYAPVAARLRVTRDIAKVAVLGAMYGATTGESAHALRGLEREYPIAMRCLSAAAEAGQRGDDVFTIGGRRVRMWVDDDIDGDIDRARRVAAARGRFARNALIQGAAAELFKVWAILVRSRSQPLGARVVLCLHDELLVHAPVRQADEVAAVLTDALAEAAFRWSPEREVRFVADVSVIRRWSEAKDERPVDDPAPADAAPAGDPAR
jgi:DNA polymerase-1